MIKEILDFYKMTPAQLAKFLGVSYYTVDRWMREKNPVTPKGLQEVCLNALWSFAVYNQGNKRLLLSKIRFGMGYFILLGLNKGAGIDGYISE